MPRLGVGSCLPYRLKWLQRGFGGAETPLSASNLAFRIPGKASIKWIAGCSPTGLVGSAQARLALLAERTRGPRCTRVPALGRSRTPQERYHVGNMVSGIQIAPNAWAIPTPRRIAAVSRGGADLMRREEPLQSAGTLRSIQDQRAVAAGTIAIASPSAGAVQWSM
jgi:hypothetical protein